MATTPKRRRKPRSDRNHVIYRLTCIVTGEFYIGVTVMDKQAWFRAIKRRFKGHVRSALQDGHEWNLHIAIRLYGAKMFKLEKLEIVRGKAKGHQREAELINEINPPLNTKKQKQCRVAIAS